ncbi:MAG: lysophospholipase [Solirubrobacteraceae bacterium]|nr:lysophospholipase [Solirubrobacteraceae bacterium]
MPSDTEISAPLSHHQWTRPGVTRTAIALHGLGDHAGRFDRLARDLVDAGWNVFAPDQRGHGRSPGSKGLVADFDRVVADLDAFVGWAAETHAAEKPVLIGHSWGGLLALRYAVAHQENVAGLALSAPASQPPSRVAGLARPLVDIVGRVVPRARVTRLPIRELSRDPDVVAAFRSDPLTTDGWVTARTASETMRAMDAVAAGISSLTLPVLLMHGTADRIADIERSRFVYDHVGSRDRTIKLYDGLRHQVFNEPERDIVVADLVRWLDARWPAFGR